MRRRDAEQFCVVYELDRTTAYWVAGRGGGGAEQFGGHVNLLRSVSLTQIAAKVSSSFRISYYFNSILLAHNVTMDKELLEAVRIARTDTTSHRRLRETKIFRFTFPYRFISF